MFELVARCVFSHGRAQKDLSDGCGQFVLQLGEKRDELDLSLALLGSSVDITRTSIEGC